MKKVLVSTLIIFCFFVSTYDVKAFYTGISASSFTNRRNGHQSQCRSFGSVSGSPPAGQTASSCVSVSGGGGVVRPALQGNTLCFYSVGYGTASITVTIKDVCTPEGVGELSRTVSAFLTEWGLNNLSISGVSISPSFNNSKFAYTATVPYGTESIEISARANDPDSKIKGTGTVPLVEGKNVLSIVVTTPQSYSNTYKITVTREAPKFPTGIKIDKESLNMYAGNEETLIASVIPEGAINSHFIWSSSNTAVASVNNGVVKAVGNGRSVITVKTADGKFSAQCVVNVTTLVNSVEFDNESITIDLNSSQLIEYSVLPSTATNKNVTFSSSDNSIVSVDENGKITGIKIGLARITVKTVDGGFIASCEVNVVSRVASVELMQKSFVLEFDDTVKLEYVIKPDTARNRDVKFSSSNNSVASVDEEGNVLAINRGVAKITITTVDGGFTDTCNITVIPPPNEIVLNDKNFSLFIGEKKVISFKATPDGVDISRIIFESDNNDIASVDSSGTITGNAVGSTKIIVRTDDNVYRLECSVVVSKAITGIHFENKSINGKIGEIKKAKYIIEPVDATNKEVVWSSDNSSVAVVDNYGNIIINDSGKANITVKTVEGEYFDTLELIVDSPTSIPYGLIFLGFFILSISIAVFIFRKKISKFVSNLLKH